MKKSAFAAMPLKQLVSLQSEIAEAIEIRRVAEHAALREKLSKMAAEAGYRLEAILEDPNMKRRTRRLPPVPVKYVDPQNPENTWSGRGRQARWLTAYLKQGKKLEQFRVAG